MSHLLAQPSLMGARPEVAFSSSSSITLRVEPFLRSVTALLILLALSIYFELLYRNRVFHEGIDFLFNSWVCLHESSFLMFFSQPAQQLATL